MKKIFICLLLLLLPLTVFADTGPKPSITVKLKNMKSTNYIVDLLSDFSDKKDHINDIVDHYETYKEEPIYKYHEDYMYATTLRNFLLHGNIDGNKEHTHYFGYFGVPTEFKVIVQMPDGSVRVSELIEKTAFDYNVTIDINDMKVVSENKDINIFKYIKILLITVIIELLLALLFKIKKYYVIIITNIVTNTLLQFAMFRNSSILLFIIFEIIVFISEYFIYYRYIEIDKKKLLLYTALANIITMLITFIM